MSTNDLLGSVYLHHLAEPIGNFANPRAMAQHYIGFTERTVDERTEDHKAGRGSPMLAAATQRGVEFHVVRVWNDVDRNFERTLKNKKNARKLCPECNPRLKEASK